MDNRPLAASPCVVAQDGARLYLFERPIGVEEAKGPDGVVAALRRTDAALADGFWVAGFLAYEAAPAFGLAARPRDPSGPPVLWLGVFGPPREVAASALRGREVSPRSPPTPVVDEAGYATGVARILERVAAGDTYQVNFTFSLEGPLLEDPWDLFARLVAAQAPRHAAYVDVGRFVVASASPELFFKLANGVLTTRPMKGTAPRGASPEADAGAAASLQASEKERAENLMIVDMMRNDLGRVAEVGTVRVPALFEIERYPTLLQMTSTVTARTRASLSEIMAALFPCASVTGAPKKRTMEIISLEEAGPRGVYTGAVGWAGPDGRACFSVAIRTALVDRDRSTLVFGVGSGIVADSLAPREYAECLLKARILHEAPFALIETLAFRPGDGYRRLPGHLARLGASARHFGWEVDLLAAERALQEVAVTLVAPHRVRLLAWANGAFATDAQPLGTPLDRPARVGLARRPVSRDDARLYHKTTRRDVYDAARASRPDCDDVLLWNDDGEITESSVANVAFVGEGGLVTPAVACGLLAGVERAWLLAEGRLREGVVRTDEVRPGERLWLLNSVRGLWEAELVG